MAFLDWAFRFPASKAPDLFLNAEHECLVSGVFVAFVNKRDRDNDRAVGLVDELRKGQYGLPYTSDYVFDEAVTVAPARTRRMSVSLNAGALILGSRESGIPALARMLRIDT